MTSRTDSASLHESPVHAGGCAELRETPAFTEDHDGLARAGDRDGSASDEDRDGGEAVPNLPALIERLPDDDTRKPQVEFTSEVRRVFLEALSVVGSVRSAAKRARVSHQTVYRARRACPAFRRCWDAALLHALPRAEDVLATRAIDGVEETVFYHGEEVAKRRRAGFPSK